MTEPLHDMLPASLEEVMQNMCFILPQENDEASSTETAWVERMLDFTGPVRGTFRLRAPLNAAAHISADFLGEDCESLKDQQIQEVMSEMANVVCGNVLGHCYPRDAFALTSPCEPATPTAWQGRKFEWEDGMIEVWVHSEPAA